MKLTDVPGDSGSNLATLAGQLAESMVARNIAVKVHETDHRASDGYWALTTPGAFGKRLVTVAVLGYPEQVGVWSYTLLKQSRIDESSMEPYFAAFAQNDLGLVAINPNFPAPDMEGSSFLHQLDRALSNIPAESAVGLVGFSMGGRMLVEFLAGRPDVAARTAGLVLIDPTLPNRLSVGDIRSLLNTNTLLVASDGEPESPGKVASALLDIPAISFPGTHGEMPNKALADIVRFLAGRLPEPQPQK